MRRNTSGNFHVKNWLELAGRGTSFEYGLALGVAQRPQVFGQFFDLLTRVDIVIEVMPPKSVSRIRMVFRSVICRILSVNFGIF